jgi:hypothetical protein
MASYPEKYRPSRRHDRAFYVALVFVFVALCIPAIHGSAEVTVDTGKLTITGGTPPPPSAPFPTVTVNTSVLTITGGTPPPPAAPFPTVTVNTDKLTITGKTK